MGVRNSSCLSHLLILAGIHRDENVLGGFHLLYHIQKLLFKALKESRKDPVSFRLIVQYFGSAVL